MFKLLTKNPKRPALQILYFRPLPIFALLAAFFCSSSSFAIFPSDMPMSDIGKAIEVSEQQWQSLKNETNIILDENHVVAPVGPRSDLVLFRIPQNCHGTCKIESGFLRANETDGFDGVRTTQEEIGHGTQGKVYRFTLELGLAKQEFALKCYIKANNDPDLKLLQFHSVPNIIRVYGSVDKCTLMELAQPYASGNLPSKQFSKELFEAMKAIGKHGDLKPENLMIGPNGNLKVIDLNGGYANYLYGTDYEAIYLLLFEAEYASLLAAQADGSPPPKDPRERSDAIHFRIEEVFSRELNAVLYAYKKEVRGEEWPQIDDSIIKHFGADEIRRLAAEKFGHDKEKNQVSVESIQILPWQP